MSKNVWVYTEEFQQYDMGSQHPLKPIRLQRTHELLDLYGALAGVTVLEPSPCSNEALLTTHSAEFIEVVDRLSAGEHVPFPFRYGFGYGDNPVFPGMWEASLLYTGASVDAAQAVVDGAQVAINISGGLHHAHRERAAGFCVFNDCAVAIHRMKQRFERIAYVDIDVHHGDGVQEAFYEDPTVLTISVHETGQTLFPGTGFVREKGVGRAVGYSVNLPMWPYTNDEIWYHTWSSTALPILKAFEPDAICLEMGADPHYLDPLARLCLTAQGWCRAIEDVKSLGKPVVALGGGGYNQTTVPRMWALAYSVLCDVPLPNDTPVDYSMRDRVPRIKDDEEPAIAPYDLKQAWSHAEQTIGEIREQIFPAHGL